VLVEGVQRAKVLKYTDHSEYYEAEAIALGDTMGECVEAKALARSATTEFDASIFWSTRDASCPCAPILSFFPRIPASLHRTTKRDNSPRRAFDR